MTATFAEERPDVVTADKCQFDLVDVAFKLSEPGKTTGSPKVPFHMVARSKGVINHWWWGRMVHDLEGMSVNEPVVVDYCHNDDQIIGATTGFSIGEQGLIVDGFVLRKPKQPNHIANDILDNAAEEVPYQASIKFAENFGLEIEEVPAGITVMVNGGSFEGPGVVFRKWHLRAVTICPHGYDHNTSSDFQLSKKSVLLTYQGDAMSTATQKPSTPAPAGGQSQSPSVDLSALQAQITELSQRVAALPAPEPPKDPVTELTETVGNLSAQFDEMKKAIEGLKPAGQGDGQQTAPPPEPGDNTELSDLASAVAELSAKFDHFSSSGGNPARGSGGEGKSKPSWEDAFAGS